MTKNQFRFSFFIFLSIILLASCGEKKSVVPQDTPIGNRKSPIAISSIKHKNTYVKVVYGQPYRKGRAIFGEWEPYGEIWRTGANEATEITITEPILMNMEVIDPGTYSLFTIPNEDSWTIILNNSVGLWGAFDYNQQLDAFRFDIPVINLETPIEAFTISFSDLDRSVTTMSLSWDVVKIEIPIRFY